MGKFQQNPSAIGDFITNQAIKARKFRKELNKAKVLKELVTNPNLDQDPSRSILNGITSPPSNT